MVCTLTWSGDVYKDFPAVVSHDDASVIFSSASPGPTVVQRGSMCCCVASGQDHVLFVSGQDAATRDTVARPRQGPASDTGGAASSPLWSSRRCTTTCCSSRPAKSDSRTSSSAGTEWGAVQTLGRAGKAAVVGEPCRRGTASRACRGTLRSVYLGWENDGGSETRQRDGWVASS